MASANSCFLIGNLCSDVELKYLASGNAVANVRLAVNDRVKKGEEWVDEATYLDCVLWGKTAETAGKYLSKGSPVYFEGRLKLEQWEKDGEKRQKLIVVVNRLQLLGSKGDGGGERSGGSRDSERSEQRRSTTSGRNATHEDQDSGSGDSNEDIPF